MRPSINSSYLLALCCLSIVLVSCDRKNEQSAIDLVQHFKPVGAQHDLLTWIGAAITIDSKLNIIDVKGWSAQWTSEGVYKVTFAYNKNTERQEITFAADIRSGRVVALNEQAETYLAILYRDVK